MYKYRPEVHNTRSLHLVLGHVRCFIRTNQGGGGGRKSAYFFEDIAVPGNGANHMSIKPLLRMTSTKTLFSYSISHYFISLHMYNANLHGFFSPP